MAHSQLTTQISEILENKLTNSLFTSLLTTTWVTEIKVYADAAYELSYSEGKIILRMLDGIL